MSRFDSAWLNAREMRQGAKLGEPMIADGEVLEMPLHEKIIEHCNAQWPRWKYIRARSDLPSTIAKGAQDFTIFMPHGRTLCVECKSRTGKPDEDQRNWAHEMQKIGHVVHVVRSMDEFLKLL